MNHNMQIDVPDQGLLELARRFQNKDWLATYERQTVCDSALNHTNVKAMQVVLVLIKNLKKSKVWKMLEK